MIGQPGQLQNRHVILIRFRLRELDDQFLAASRDRDIEAAQIVGGFLTTRKPLRSDRTEPSKVAPPVKFMSPVADETVIAASRGGRLLSGR